MSVLTKKYRPDVFEQVIGQDLAKKLLMATAKKPEESSKSLILYGPWGTGKTTLARVFGRALACESFQKTGKICMKCDNCKSFDTVSNRYIEYDSSHVGKAQQVKDLQPVFEQWTDYYRVIVFDESHMISSTAQSALLKVIEEGPPKTFFLFVSTEFDQMLKTVKSRSIPVEFFSVDQNVIMGHLKEIWQKELPDEEPSMDALEKIAFKVDGHVRDAVMLLSIYMVARDEELLNVPIDDIAKFFLYLGRGDVEKAEKMIELRLMKYPLEQIRRGLNYVILRMVEEHTLKRGTAYRHVTDLLKEKVYKIFQLTSEVWAQRVFVSKELTYSFFLTLIRIYGKNGK